jgi:hypothetical protein
MSRLTNTFVIFTIGFIFIWMTKPQIFFRGDQVRPFIFNGKKVNSLITLHTFVILWAILSHLLASKLK